MHTCFPDVNVPLQRLRPAWRRGVQTCSIQCRNKLARKTAAKFIRHDPSKDPPRLDYVARMRAREQDATQCPLLMLAPMENLADRPFRMALADTTGGFDEACIEFMRVPRKPAQPQAAVRGVCTPYDAAELAQWDAALGAQVMGSEPEVLALAADYLARVKRAPRVDLNCGCPANSVTGNGAGSSLLRTPELLHECVKAMVAAAGSSTTISLKMRAGYDDSSLFEENLLAAQEGGAAFVTIHPRTKRQTYEGRADWGLVARARQLLHIPVVGNGDVVSVAAAKQLLEETKCHGIMIGRGAVQDPLLFQRIRAAFAQPELGWDWNEPETVVNFLHAFAYESWGAREEALAAAASSSDGSGSDSDAPSPNSSSHHVTSAADQGTSTSAGVRRSAAERAELNAELGRTPRRYDTMSERGKFGRLKKVAKYLFNATPGLARECEQLLRVAPGSGMSADELLDQCCKAVMREWPASGPSRLALVNHMGKSVQVVMDSTGSSSDDDSSCCNSSLMAADTAMGARLEVALL